MKMKNTLSHFVCGAFLLCALPALAADTRKAPAPSASPSAAEETLGSGAERVNVENIKEKYWARGDESELGVVQNRLYSKEKKLEIGIYGGIVTTDPFLTVKNTGLLMSFHFSEYLALGLVGYKSFVTPSAALSLLEAPLDNGGLGTTTNTNEPRWYVGTEVSGSILYGKLSLIGKAIIHYDMHLLGGLGVTATESGNYFTPSIGIGQQIYLSKWMALRLDYRLMRFNETIREKVRFSTMGNPVGERTNYSNSVTIGVDFLINLFGKTVQPEASK